MKLFVTFSKYFLYGSFAITFVYFVQNAINLTDGCEIAMAVIQYAQIFAYSYALLYYL
jgi:UDP-N-acetylmuramyl pentapeptide phosphotransferase/UDP-N-acetylglucosamine-1-phosphate transferase